jgi:hypothetical protein
MVLFANCGRLDGLSVIFDADSSGNPNPEPSTSPAPALKRVFVTSGTFTGNLGGLSGSWTAYVSTSAVNAKDRITGSGPWYLVDQTTVAINSDDELGTAVAIAHKIDTDELGATVEAVGDYRVWTGTNGFGMYNSTVLYLACQDWTSASFAETGVTGNTQQSASTWKFNGSTNCNATQRLYCFEE